MTSIERFYTSRRGARRLDEWSRPERKARHGGLPQVCFIKNTVSNPNIEMGDYTYDDDPDDSENFARGVKFIIAWWHWPIQKVSRNLAAIVGADVKALGQRPGDPCARSVVGLHDTGLFQADPAAIMKFPSRIRHFVDW